VCTSSCWRRYVLPEGLGGVIEHVHHAERVLTNTSRMERQAGIAIGPFRSRAHSELRDFATQGLLRTGHNHDPHSRLLQVAFATHQAPLRYPSSSCCYELLGRSPLKLNGAAEALILLSANARLNNQWPDAVGDAFLNPATLTHLFDNGMRICALSHVVHDSRANNHRTWGLFVGKMLVDQQGVSYAKCDIPQRGVQDCIEALSGAAL